MSYLEAIEDIIWKLKLNRRNVYLHALTELHISTTSLLNQLVFSSHGDQSTYCIACITVIL